MKAVVNYFGPTDLAAKDIPADLQAAGEGFPGRHAGREARGGGQGLAAHVCLHRTMRRCSRFRGPRTRSFPIRQAIKLADAMNTAGVAGRVELLIGARTAGPAPSSTERSTRLFSSSTGTSRPRGKKP